MTSVTAREWQVLHSLPNVLDSQGTELIKLVLVLVPIVAEILKLVDLIGKIEGFGTCDVNGVDVTSRICYRGN